MDSLKFSIFDIFAYIMPGLVGLLAAMLLLDTSIIGLMDVARTFQNIDLGTGIAVAAVAYIVGSGIDSIGDWLYKSIGFRLWGYPYVETPVGILQERALVREYSPENYTYLQIWKVMSSMSHNLSASTLILAIVCIIRAVNLHLLEWGVLAVVAVVFSVIFLRRAHVFNYMHYRDMANTVEALHLEQRAIKDSGGRKGQKGS